MEEDVRMTRLKLYLGPLLPVDPKKLDGLDVSKINFNKVQMFLYEKEDIHRELFSHILLMAGKRLNRKPTFEVVNFNKLIEEHFDKENTVYTSSYAVKEILFIIYTTANLENKIYGPVMDKIIEERKMFGKPTFIYYKGTSPKMRNLKATSIDEYIDLNITRSPSKRNEVI